MKTNLIFLVGAFCLLTDALAEEWTERNNKCLSCMDPLQTQYTGVTYCTAGWECEYGTLSSSCSSAPRVMGVNPKVCVDQGWTSEHSACATFDNTNLNETPRSSTITLPGSSFCYITVSGASKTLKVSYPSSSVAFYYPSTGNWGSSARRASGTLIDAAAINQNEIKVALVNFNPSTNIIFTIEAADTSAPDSNNSNNGGGSNGNNASGGGNGEGNEIDVQEEDGGLCSLYFLKIFLNFLAGGQIAGIVLGCVGLTGIAVAGIWKSGAIRRLFQTKQEKVVPGTGSESMSKMAGKIDIETVFA